MKGIIWAVLISPLLIPRRLAEGYPHHITLFFNVNRDQYQYLEGQEFTAIAETECWNSEIQAVKVSLPKPVPCEKQHPHITISRAESVPPSQSNRMLAQEHHTKQWQAISLTCQIEFHQLRPRLFDFFPTNIDKRLLRRTTIEDVHSWTAQGVISGITNASTAERFSRILRVKVTPQPLLIPVDPGTDFIAGVYSSTSPDTIDWFIYEAP